MWQQQITLQSQRKTMQAAGRMRCHTQAPTACNVEAVVPFDVQKQLADLGEHVHAPSQSIVFCAEFAMLLARFMFPPSAIRFSLQFHVRLGGGKQQATAQRETQAQQE